ARIPSFLLTDTVAVTVPPGVDSGHRGTTLADLARYGTNTGALGSTGVSLGNTGVYGTPSVGHAGVPSPGGLGLLGASGMGAPSIGHAATVPTGPGLLDPVSTQQMLDALNRAQPIPDTTPPKK